VCSDSISRLEKPVVGRCCTIARSHNPCFRCALVAFLTIILAHVLDSLVRVTRRVGERHFDSIFDSRSVGLWVRTPRWVVASNKHHKHRVRTTCPQAVTQKPQSSTWRTLRSYNTSPQTRHLLRTALPHAKLMLTSLGLQAARGHTTAQRFPSSDFRHYFTLSSEFFSPFLHSTCSLSVSHAYLALDGIYHPLRDALPSIPTLLEPDLHCAPVGRGQHNQVQTGLSPSPIPRSRGVHPWRCQHGTDPSRLQLSNEIFSLSYSRFTRRY